MFGLNWQWKLALFGLGALAGAAGFAVLSGRPSRLRSGAASVLSHGLALRESAENFVETMKEGMEDLAAEAELKLKTRRGALDPVSAPEQA